MNLGNRVLEEHGEKINREAKAMKLVNDKFDRSYRQRNWTMGSCWTLLCYVSARICL